MYYSTIISTKIEIMNETVLILYEKIHVKTREIKNIIKNKLSVS